MVVFIKDHMFYKNFSTYDIRVLSKKNDCSAVNDGIFFLYSRSGIRKCIPFVDSPWFNCIKLSDCVVVLCNIKRYSRHQRAYS